MGDRGRKVATIFDRRSSGEDSDDSEGRERREKFYVGGSSKSGQQVLGPLKKDSKKPAGADVVRRFFTEAAKHSGNLVSADDLPDGQAAVPTAGARLGGTSRQESNSADDRTLPQRHVKLQLWSDCFTVDGGPSRTYDNPENMAFLDEIMHGSVPKELTRVGDPEEVIVKVENRGTEKYVPPKYGTVPFSGKGYKLGSPTPQVLGAGKVGERYHPKETAEKPAELSDTMEEFPVDDSKPTTNLQIRLPDGSRLVMRVNLHLTVRDIRLMICRKKPELACCEFVLMAGFPATRIEEEDKTIEEANLRNAALIVRLIE